MGKEPDTSLKSDHMKEEIVPTALPGIGNMLPDLASSLSGIESVSMSLEEGDFISLVKHFWIFFSIPQILRLAWDLN